MRTRSSRFLLLPLMLASLAAQAANCTLSNTDLAFGIMFGDTPGDNLSVGNISVECSSATAGEMLAFTVELSAGNSASFAGRKMTMAGGGSELAYNVYIDANRTLVWGDGTMDSQPANANLTVASSTGASRVTLPAYGLVPGSQNVEPGDYRDILLITLTY